MANLLGRDIFGKRNNLEWIKRCASKDSSTSSLRIVENRQTTVTPIAWCKGLTWREGAGLNFPLANAKKREPVEQEFRKVK